MHGDISQEDGFYLDTGLTRSKKGQNAQEAAPLAQSPQGQELTSKLEPFKVKVVLPGSAALTLEEKGLELGEK